MIDINKKLLDDIDKILKTEFEKLPKTQWIKYDDGSIAIMENEKIRMHLGTGAVAEVEKIMKEYENKHREA